jgi:uncharacterized protein
MRAETFDGHRIEVLSNRDEMSGAPKTAIICCHGITSHRHEFMGQLDAFAAACARMSIACYRFDFRGHGTSNLPTTSMSIFGEWVDLDAVYRAVAAVTDVPIHLLGISFGALSCGMFRAWSAAPVEGLALWNPVMNPKATLLDGQTDLASRAFNPNFRHAIAEALQWNIQGFRLGFPLLSEIHQFPIDAVWTADTLSNAIVFHGDQDDVVPLEFNQAILAKHGAVRLDMLHGERHGFANKQAYVIGETIKWMERSF